MYSVVYYAVQFWYALRACFRTYPYIKLAVVIIGMFAGVILLPEGWGVLTWSIGSVFFFVGSIEIAARLMKLEQTRMRKGVVDKAMRDWARKKAD